MPTFVPHAFPLAIVDHTRSPDPTVIPTAGVPRQEDRAVATPVGAIDRLGGIDDAWERATTHTLVLGAVPDSQERSRGKDAGLERHGFQDLCLNDRGQQLCPVLSSVDVA